MRCWSGGRVTETTAGDPAKPAQIALLVARAVLDVHVAAKAGMSPAVGGGRLVMERSRMG